MSGERGAGFTFLPWVQRGLARSIGVEDDPNSTLTARVTLPVTLRVDGVGDVATTVRLYGPGDITGIERGQVTRVEPRSGTTSFEAGYMASVQFARPDLPWLFTPAAARADRLRPWVVLVVVRRREGVRLAREGGPLPVLVIESPARAADELPDLAQSWAWAHAQIAGIPADRTPAQILDAVPGVSCSRLVCPRRLEPGRAYLACVVPAFAIGVKAGLGEPVEAADEQMLAPAWTADAGAVRLPVYHSWEFATGAAGSFETLVRRLQPRPLDPESTRPPALGISNAGGGLPSFDAGAEGAVIGMQSALRAPGADALPPWPDDTRVPFQQALERVLTSARADTITAPAYGQAQSGRETLPAESAEPEWLRELNLDPRLRVVAAAGARVIRARQEQLMARAWTQAGAIRDANALLRRSQLARELGGVLMSRHLQRMTPSELLAVTQPVHARAEISTQTVDGELRASRLPEAVVSGAMRRMASPQGLLARRTRPGAARRGPIDLLPAADRAAVARRSLAPVGMVAMTVAIAPQPDRAERPAVSAQSIQARLLARLDPVSTVLERTKERVAAPPGTWTRPDPLAPVDTGIEFPDPMYDGLRDVAPELLLPGLQNVQPDSVALLETSPRVIEAYMVGVNHEMNRELLWREFPANLSGTPFRQFWDVRGQRGDPESLADIPAIVTWGGTRLGIHVRGSNAGGQLVLIVRGELLRRYPATTIYAVRANADGMLEAATRLAPMFRGFVAPDVVFVGFALSEEAALGVDPPGPGWYFAFEEHPGEPRFGFDEVAETDTPQSPNDLAWPHVPVSASAHVDVLRPLSGAAADLQAAWGRDAAGMAALTLQQPFRVAIHASKLLRMEPPE